jgi:hypothetical protein
LVYYVIQNALVLFTINQTTKNMGMNLGLSQSQELSQRIDISLALQIELDTNPKRLEVSLEEIFEFPGDYRWNKVSDDESDYSPDSVRELEREKEKLNEKYYVIPDKGYVAMVSINPLTFSNAWPRTWGEGDDGSFEEGSFCEGVLLPPRVKISLWDYVR